MEHLYWLLIGILLLIILVLSCKIHALHQATQEIAQAFRDRTDTDTNTLIDLSTRDKYMRFLAVVIGDRLRTLREKELRFRHGDRELKTAITGISHDLRTPLTAICGYLDLLESEPLSENARKYLTLIRSRTDAMKNLTEELFRYSVVFSGEEPLTLTEVNVTAVLEEAIAGFYGALCGRGITPELHLTEEPVIRQGDKKALSRVFGNLLSNALRYSDGDLTITLTEKGKITFANHASGLSEVQVGRLFDRFYTVNAGRTSTGLGLSIAKTLLTQMGGSIVARYHEGELVVEVELLRSEVATLRSAVKWLRR